jgi:hypothetical protein
LVEIDGKPFPNSPTIPLIDDGRDHQIRVVLGQGEAFGPASPFIEVEDETHLLDKDGH